MDEADAPFADYVAMWRLIQAQDIAIRYEHAATGRGEAASFQAQGWAVPNRDGSFRKKDRIRIHRPYAVENPEEPTPFTDKGQQVSLAGC